MHSFTEVQQVKRVFSDALHRLDGLIDSSFTVLLAVLHNRFPTMLQLQNHFFIQILYEELCTNGSYD